MLDFHNHLIPGVDDGAATIDESREGIATMVAAGVTEIICTPHISGAVNGSPRAAFLDRVDASWERLTSLVRAQFPSVPVHRGFEVMLDTPHLVIDDPRMCLAGTAFVLVEFPGMAVPVNSTFAIRKLRDAGFIPIIAHPERYANIASQPSILDQWRGAGAYLQVNAGSFVGAYGTRAKEMAMKIIEGGHADYLCSDYHSRGRCYLSPALALLERIGFGDHLAIIRANGFRIPSGKLPEPVGYFSPLPSQKFWKRFLPW